MKGGPQRAPCPRQGIKPLAHHDVIPHPPPTPQPNTTPTAGLLHAAPPGRLFDALMAEFQVWWGPYSRSKTSLLYYIILEFQVGRACGGSGPKCVSYARANHPMGGLWVAGRDGLARTVTRLDWPGLHHLPDPRPLPPHPNTQPCTTHTNVAPRHGRRRWWRGGTWGCWWTPAPRRPPRPAAAGAATPAGPRGRRVGMEAEGGEGASGSCCGAR
jgi:hypothetical protein